MNTPFFTLLRENLTPKRLTLALAILLIPFYPTVVDAQCDYDAGLGCAVTDYNNFGYYSTNDPASIEYDNYVTGFHQTAIREKNGNFLVWGDAMDDNGYSNVLTPKELNATNYPGLTGTVLKVAIGSSVDAKAHQTIVLTTDGLFAFGKPGIVLSSLITSTEPFAKLTIGGETDGLPAGLSATDVKMLFATYKAVVITTCSGEVWVLSENDGMRGNGGIGSENTWSKVTTSEAGNPDLTGVVAARGSATGLIALRNDNTLWTWGKHVYLGNGSAPSSSIKRATKMVSPAPGIIKMIGGTSDGSLSSYYVLYVDGSLYSLGENSKRQLGDWTTDDKQTWVQPRYNSASGKVMKDIRWISPMEHNWKYPSINVITSDMKLYNWGAEQNYNLGRGNDLTETFVNPGMPAGFSGTDQVLTVETGGHSTMFTILCNDKIGFVGYHGRGSMGDGLSSPITAEGTPFYTPNDAPVCGMVPIINAWGITAGPSGKVCASSTVLLDALPTGGTLSVVSGPGSISGNVLSFSGTGTVVVQYQIVLGCETKTTTKTFETENCTVYKVKGSVWGDDNENVVVETGESGTNTGSYITDGLWANLVNTSEKVTQSVPVGDQGDYELATTDAGDYSVEITNGQIAVGSTIPASSRVLPDNWHYTGNNDGTPCVVPACVTPYTIAGISLGGGSPAAGGLNFGIIFRVMPIKLISFNAYKDGGIARLTWATGTEQNNKGFDIQRSSDGKNWISIGWQDSQSENGNSSTTLNYYYTDNHPLEGMNFYRLKQTDFDGRAAYSEVKAVSFRNNNRAYIVYPNPTKDVVNVKGLSGNEIIKIYDFSGRQLSAQQVTNTSAVVDLSHYLSGVYQISVTGSNGENKTFQIIRK